jgi:hypothetical protein
MDFGEERHQGFQEVVGGRREMQENLRLNKFGPFRSLL